MFGGRKKNKQKTSNEKETAVVVAKSKEIVPSKSSKGILSRRVQIEINWFGIVVGGSLAAIACIPGINVVAAEVLIVCGAALSGVAIVNAKKAEKMMGKRNAKVVKIVKTNGCCKKEAAKYCCCECN